MFLYFFVPQMSPTYWIIILMVFDFNLFIFMNLLNTLYLKLYINDIYFNFLKWTWIWYMIYLKDLML